MKNTSLESISVIIPYYNDSIAIERTLNSIISQTILPAEIIIVDDCSEDSEKLNDIVNAFRKNTNIDIRIHRNKTNKNGAYSRNLGINLASSKYIALLDADDFWEKNHLELNSIAIKNNIDFLYSNYISYNRDRTIEVKVTNHKKLENKFDILFYSPPQTNSFFFLKEKVVSSGVLFDESLRRHQDWDFLIKALSSDLSVEYFDLSTSFYCESHRDYKSRVNFDSMIYFWIKNFKIFSRKKVIKYLNYILQDIYLTNGYDSLIFYIEKYELEKIAFLRMFRFFEMINMREKTILRKTVLFFYYLYLNPNKLKFILVTKLK